MWTDHAIYYMHMYVSMCSSESVHKTALLGTLYSAQYYYKQEERQGHGDWRLATLLSDWAV